MPICARDRQESRRGEWEREGDREAEYVGQNGDCRDTLDQ